MAAATSTPSKGDINRAGRLAARCVHAFERGDGDWLEGTDIAALNQALTMIDWWRALHARPLTSLSANLRHYVKPHGTPLVTQRLKRLPTVIDKLIREPKMNLTQMVDIGGCRALLPNQDAVSEVTRRLRRNWEVQRVRDYVTQPKDSGYRAVHLYVRRKGRMIEVQLRTPWQDFWANQVEEDSRRVGQNFKGGLGQAEVHEYYAAVSDLFALREKGQQPDDDLRERLAKATATAAPFLARGDSK